MKTSSISVIIPVWNNEKTLTTTVLSCLNQTLPPQEILVCDDGSTDNSKEIIEKINNPIVVWIPGEHSGTPAVPRNNGIKIAKGEWIAFCDSDDEWLPSKLEKQIGLMDKQKTKASCTNALIKINKLITNKTVITYNKKQISIFDIIKNNNVVGSSSIVHSSIMKYIDGFVTKKEYGVYADFMCWLRVTTKTNFSFIHESLVIYDDHPSTSMRTVQTPHFVVLKNSFRNFIDWYKEKPNTPKSGLYKLSMIIQLIKIYIKYIAVKLIKKNNEE